jgi:arylsulfatase A-like enzyme
LESGTQSAHTKGGIVIALWPAQNTLWEGGTRVVGMVAGPGVAQGAVLQMPVHATDWLPTLVSMATGGADFRRWAPPGEPPYLAGDGVDVWSTIASAGKNGTVQRDWVLLEAHPKNAQNQVHGDALIMGDWK